MKAIIILCLAIIVFGCRTASKTTKMQAIADKNKDVVVLSYLIRDYMRKTRNTNFTLSEILSKDSLKRLSNNFSVLETGYWGNPWEGGISFFYKFSPARNSDSIHLQPGEAIPWKVKEKKLIGKTEAQLAKRFDGEMRFSYPERHYSFRTIILKRNH